jgi:hypothetical protein
MHAGRRALHPLAGAAAPPASSSTLDECARENSGRKLVQVSATCRIIIITGTEVRQGIILFFLSTNQSHLPVCSAA